MRGTEGCWDMGTWLDPCTGEYDCPGWLDLRQLLTSSSSTGVAARLLRRLRRRQQKRQRARAARSNSPTMTTMGMMMLRLLLYAGAAAAAAAVDEAADVALVDEAVVEVGEVEVAAGVCVATWDSTAVTADPAMLMNWFSGLTLDD